MRYRKAYEWGKTRLEIAQIAEAALDARLLLEHVCQTTRNDLYAHSEMELSQAQEEAYEAVIIKRAKRIPLQHITKVQDFMGLSFNVNENVLIPRQDTEILAEEALIALNDGDSLLDLCTGSGCVLISVCKYKNDISGVGTDISDKALEVAKANYAGYESEISGTIEFRVGDLYKPVDGMCFDVIVSNPPYIRTDEIASLQSEVKDYDPFIALDGGEDGLVFYRRIIGDADKYLKPEGKLIMEIGFDQAEDVKSLLEENGFTEIKVIKDLSGLDRVIRGRKNV